MFALLRRCLTFHPLVTFGLMVVAFAGFSLAGYDLFRLFIANADYLSREGLMGLMEGGALQLALLLLNLIAVCLCYVLFKACEQVLVAWITRG